MEIRPLIIEGAYEVLPKVFRDDRGSFSMVYLEDEFARAGLVTAWTGDNQSFNVRRGTLRGLHFQGPPSSQTKLVRAVVGRAFDVLVDLRPGSPTFKKWAGVELSDEKANSLYIPKGCAHGYLTLTDGCAIAYKVDAPYAPQVEGGLLWSDPEIGIEWPEAGELLISEKDRGWPGWEGWKNPF